MANPTPESNSIDNSLISRKEAIDVVDNEVDYWAMFINVSGQGEDADVSAWTLMAVLDEIKEKLNGLRDRSRDL